MIFLGCDGGSTKTEWLLVDHTGQVLAHRLSLIHISEPTRH